MPESPLEPRGLLDNVLTGYGLAWVHRRQLLAVLLPVLVPVLVASVVLDVAVDRDHLVIVNGGWVVAGGSGGLSWLRVGLNVSAWLLALTAGTLVVTGGLRERTVRPGAALLVAGRRFPLLLVGVGVVGGAAFAAVAAVTGLASAVGGMPGVGLIVAVLVALAVLAARILIWAMAGLFGENGWELTKGRILGTAGAFLLGGIAIPLLAAYLGDLLSSAVGWPGLADLVDAVVLTGTVAVQAGILAHVPLQRRAQAPDDPREEADLDRVDARLTALAGRPVRWAGWGAVALVLPVLLSTGVAVANPTGAPSMRSRSYASDGTPLAVAWPAGQHPVIVTDYATRFCDDDLCETYTTPDSDPSLLGGSGTVDIGPDGTVVTGAVMGSRSNGGPYLDYARCTRAGCQHGRLPVRASATAPFGWPQLAVASGPDGSLWFAFAMAAPDDQDVLPDPTVSLVRCADVTCARPQRFPAGTLAREPDDNSHDTRPGRLTIAPDGRPTAAFPIGATTGQVTCEPVTCAHPRQAVVRTDSRDAPWLAPAGGNGAAVSIGHGRLLVGEQDVPLDADAAPDSQALAAAGAWLYAAAAVPASRPPGFRVSIGTPTQYWQLVLWRCERSACRQPQRVPLDIVEEPPVRPLMAIGPAGEVLLVGTDRTVLVSVPPTT